MKVNYRVPTLKIVAIVVISSKQNDYEVRNQLSLGKEKLPLFFRLFIDFILVAIHVNFLIKQMYARKGGRSAKNIEYRSSKIKKRGTKLPAKIMRGALNRGCIKSMSKLWRIRKFLKKVEMASIRQ